MIDDPENPWPTHPAPAAQTANTSTKAPTRWALEGIEFIEYATSKPQALGQVLETMGFRPIARHRSREVLLYRQGDINVIVNAHGRGEAALTEKPVIAAIALRVRDAVCRLQACAGARRLGRAGACRSDGAAHSRRARRGQQPHLLCGSPPRVLDLRRGLHPHYPRWTKHPPAITGLHFFGVVQYIGNDRTEDWTEFYSELFGFTELPSRRALRHLAQGPHSAQPVRRRTFYLQLIEPEPGVLDVEDDECSSAWAWAPPMCKPPWRSCASAVWTLCPQRPGAQLDSKGALTRTTMGSVMFELVHHERS